MEITAVATAPCSPWQNAYVERVIGSIRREWLDYVVIFNQRHLRRGPLINKGYNDPHYAEPIKFAQFDVATLSIVNFQRRHGVLWRVQALGAFDGARFRSRLF
jgi:transposase InsO family protein